MEKVTKFYSVETKAIDLEAGIFEALISTEAVDRQGDIVRATGAKLENYLKNPVVLWAHDYDKPPVARALSIEILPGAGLKAKFQFPEMGVNPDADVVHRLWAAGFLNATSIGFIPLDAKPVNGAADDWWSPQEYVSWELLEFSIVPVPANQEALRLAAKSLKEQINVLPVSHSAEEAARNILSFIRQSSNLQEPAANAVPESLATTEQTTDDNSKQQAEVEAKAVTLIRTLLDELFEVKK